MDKVTTGSVGTEPSAVIGSAHFGLVFRMPVHGAKFFMSVRKLALISVLAGSVFLVGSAHLRLISSTGLLLILLLGGSLDTRPGSVQPHLLAIPGQQGFSGRRGSTVSELVWLVIVVDTNPQTKETVLVLNLKQKGD